MAPPEDGFDGEEDGMLAAMRLAQASDMGSDNEGDDLRSGYDSTEEARTKGIAGQAKRIKRANQEGDEGEDKELVRNGVGKKNVPKIVDSLAVTVENSFFQFLQSQISIGEDIMRRLNEFGKKTAWIRFSSLSAYDIDLATLIKQDYYRFLPSLERALQRYISTLDPAYVTNPETDSSIPSNFHISFYDLPVVDRVRDLRTDRLGQLTSVTGTVTRSSETRPELLVGVFQCRSCDTFSAGIEQEFKYTEPHKCFCGGNQGWELSVARSSFADWQKVRVQENATEVPAGSMPRSIDIICRYECVEVAKPGDKCVFTGTLIVVPDVAKLRAPGDPPTLRGVGDNKGPRFGDEQGGVSGLSSLGVRDLSYRLAFLACSVQPCDGSDMTYDQGDDSGEITRDQMRRRVREMFTEDQLAELDMMARQPNLTDKLKRSVAPAIYGHGDIKLGVLLLLFGGVHKKTPEGINLRGDINVCIVGDPSTAKSQFLRYVCSFDTRAIYTSGKASTAAGLTASVVRDPETGEFCIEAGALMLADNGVCCIDEFDKMDDIDQVAIHEAMEQQTISITKAGIQATLNARTSVLAAANPIHGRYDRSKTLKANLTVGPAIMSRFDLFFVVLDECDEVNDRAIADHIVEVHRARVAAMTEHAEEASAHLPAARKVFFTTEQMRRYVRYARTIDPVIAPEVQPLLVDYYVKLRQGDSGVGKNKQAYRITVRQLEALIRLSEAIARMHLDDVVRPKYVESAYRLLRMSIVQVESESLVVNTENEATSAIFNEATPSESQVIKQEEVQRVAGIAQEYVQARESAMENDDDYFGVLQTDLVDHILEHHTPDLEEDRIDEERKHLNTIIRMLLETQTVLVEAPLPLGWDFPEDTPDEEKVLLRLDTTNNL